MNCFISVIILFFFLIQVRRAVAQEIRVKGTMMIGPAMGLTPHPTTNPLTTPPPTLQSRLESERKTGPSGTETTVMDGSNLQPASSLSPWFLCCLCLSWSLLPPCGDSWLLQSGAGSCLSCWSLKHIMKNNESHSIWLHQQKSKQTQTV